jgi:hypothetical protein
MSIAYDRENPILSFVRRGLRAAVPAMSIVVVVGPLHALAGILGHTSPSARYHGDGTLFVFTTTIVLLGACASLGLAFLALRWKATWTRLLVMLQSQIVIALLALYWLAYAKACIPTGRFLPLFDPMRW